MEEFLINFGYDNMDQVKNELNDKNKIGFGCSSIVYKIWNKNEKKYYLLKKIEDSRISENESDILKNINHQNIVKYYYSFREKKNYYIITEYCEKLDLRKFIERYKESETENQKLIDENIILIIILDICLGLKEIHNKNIIHRDLKPENILISKDYIIKIGDFGISKKLLGTKHANTANGTWNYMAPEILLGQKYNNKVDIWSLGCIIYELLTLNTCFDCEYLFGLVEKIKNGDYDKNVLKKYDKKWENLINLLLQKDQKDRPDINKLCEIVSSMDFKEFNIEKNINSIDDISLNILKRGIENKKNKKKLVDDFNDKKITVLNLDHKFFGNKAIIMLGEIDCRNLKELHLESNNISDISNLKKINFDNLEILNLSNNQIENIEILSKINIKKLLELNLCNNKIENIDILKEINCTDLKILKLGGNKIRNNINILNKVNFKNLKELYLNHNGITDIKVFKSVNFVNLEILVLGCNTISYINILEKVNFKKLKNLDIFGNDLSQNIIILENVSFHGLEKLKLNFNEITNINFLQNVNFKLLKELNLGYNKLEDITVLEKVNFENLEILDLSSNKLSNKIDALENVNFKKLKVLDLR